MKNSHQLASRSAVLARDLAPKQEIVLDYYTYKGVIRSMGGGEFFDLVFKTVLQIADVMEKEGQIQDKCTKFHESD